jgi:exopolysaccharide production protein ExoQ
MGREKVDKVLYGFAMLFSLFLANFRIFIFSPPRAYGCIFDGWVAPDYCYVGGVALEILLWLLLGSFFLLPLRLEAVRRQYWAVWKKNRLLILFLLFSFLSLMWTIFLAGTFRNLLVLLVVTLIAVMWCVNLSRDELLGHLASFIAIMALLSLGLALALPDIGRANFDPYNGAWRGIFRNRNYLGSFMAFGNALFFLRLLERGWSNKVKFLWDFLFYLLTFSLVLLTKSATGAIVWVSLTGLLLLAFLWLHFESRFTHKHYYGLATLSLLGSAFVLSRLDFVFGLFNRNTTLTGRVDLWRYLLEEWVRKSPLVGHGYGAAWYSSLKYQAQRALGWPFLTHIGDSGFMDILLNLGWVGLGLLLAMLLLGAWRALSFAIYEKTVSGFFAPLTLVYVILTNISLSYFMELEVYVWVLLILALFLPQQRFIKDA